MRELNKIILLTLAGFFVFVIIGIHLWVGQGIFESQKDQYNNFYDSNKIRIKGVIEIIGNPDHDGAICEVKVIEVNNDSIFLETPSYIRYKSEYSTAQIELHPASCLEEGDTIIWGPGREYVVIGLNGDTIINRSAHINHCGEPGVRL